MNSPSRISKYVLLAFIYCTIEVGAQQSLTLYNMPAIPQCAYTNPALVPQSRTNIGLPLLSSVYLNVGNNGFRITDLVKKGSDDSLHLDIDNLINTLHNNNFLSQSLQVDVFSLGLRIGENYFSFSITEKENISFGYPKNFLNWAWQGNGAYLGQDMHFNFGLSAIHYREYSLGLARTLSDKLTIGLKLKYLYGMENIWAQNSDITFNTGSTDFGYTTSDNVRINTAGVDSGSFSDFKPMDYLFKKHNRGMAIDLGATYKLNDQLTFSASILDLGYINWKSNVANYVSSGSFNFDGIDFSQFVSDKGDSAFTKLSDSVQNTFHVITTHESYRTMLPLQFYIGANYTISEKQNAGLLLYGQFFNKALYSGIALSYNMKINKWLSASASYAIINRDFKNIGIGLAVTGPVQWYIVTDNIIGIFLPQSVRTVNIRTGINLCFGRKPQAEQEDDDSN